LGAALVASKARENPLRREWPWRKKHAHWPEFGA